MDGGTNSSSTLRLDLDTIKLGPLLVPRLWVGLWQLSSNAWGTASVSSIRRAMKHHVEEGYTAFGKQARHSAALRYLNFLYRYGDYSKTIFAYIDLTLSSSRDSRCYHVLFL